MLPRATFLRRRLCLNCENFTIHAGAKMNTDKVYHCNECEEISTVKEGEQDELLELAEANVV